MSLGQDTALDELLDFVRTSRGFDFTGYKRASIERRVNKRMSDLSIERIEEYMDFLELHGDEFAALFDTLLINVTSFFRDAQTWSYIQENVIPELVAEHGDTTPLRVWCAGCSSGMEAYTVAMVIAEAIGTDAFQERVKIYATDVDEPALETARHGAYSARDVEAIPAEVLNRYFEHDEQRYVFRKDLRRSVIFGRNDLIQDAPISRIDLLVCRNTLMYFTAETQAQILRRFHFALSDPGVLLLGKSEMLITHAELFTPENLKWRVYRKVIRPTLRDRVRVLSSGDGAGFGMADNLREAVFDNGTSAQIVLAADRVLVMANQAARGLFDLGANQLGRPLQDLQLSYQPLDLRGHLDSLAREPRTIELESVRWSTPEDERSFLVRMTPLLGDNVVLGTVVTYEDQTELNALRLETATVKHDLEQAYEELQSTVEELETTNEELQSTNEELETTNEELQSTNEELETMNEELQSTNEELETMNDELRHRTLELNDLNSFLDTILSTMGVAIAVLDRRQRVQIWNREARELWGLAADEAADEDWEDLDIGLAVNQVRPMIRACLRGETTREEMVLEAVNRRGRAFQCQIVCLPLTSNASNDVSGVILMMENTGD